MRRFLAAFTLVGCLLAACGGGAATGDRAAIEDTITGYVQTYNARDYSQCLTYFTGYGDTNEALASLEFFRGMSGELKFREISEMAVTGSTATVTVVFAIGGDEGTDEMRLENVGGQWKILWEQ